MLRIALVYFQYNLFEKKIIIILLKITSIWKNNINQKSHLSVSLIHCIRNTCWMFWPVFNVSPAPSEGDAWGVQCRRCLRRCSEGDAWGGAVKAMLEEVQWRRCLRGTVQAMIEEVQWSRCMRRCSEGDAWGNAVKAMLEEVPLEWSRCLRRCRSSEGDAWGGATRVKAMLEDVYALCHRHRTSGQVKLY